MRRGSLSWGLGALVMGFMTDLYGFVANFIFYAVLSFASIALTAWQMPKQTRLEKSVRCVMNAPRSVRADSAHRPFMAWAGASLFTCRACWLHWHAHTCYGSSET